MDRAIKFRAWDGKRMYNELAYITMSGSAMSYLPEIPIIKPVLMQFTGLYDCEGKEIWEGDVIEYTQHHFNTELIKVKRKIVNWNYDRWNIYETAAGETDIKVIGNLYEHPNLLTDGQVYAEKEVKD